MRIVTDSRLPEEPKDPESDNVFAIYRHFASEEDILRVRNRYLQAGMAYSEIKGELFELLEQTFGPARARDEEYMQDWGYLDNIMQKGAELVNADEEFKAQMVELDGDIIFWRFGG